uniref:Tumor necrosis factor receptor superfamily, member 11a, NFKB activator n=1 Tax=Amphilophus citrinellus TaxID=61819 RepID=A0A3Q0QTQ1_AMPCI
MRLNFSTSWIFRGWIACLLVTFYNADSKSLQCDDKHYLKGSRCCKKCQPGHYVYSHCTDSLQTICFKCNNDEYQPDWNEEKVCFKQKFCDEGEYLRFYTEEPCRCYPGFQCSSINCEYCEKIPTCPPGEGLQPTNHKIVFLTDVFVSSSWVIVSVLSVITVLCLLILLLFCYKDKMKLLSEMTGKEVVEGKMAMEEQSKGSGEPEEVSEEEKEVVSVSRLLAGSCICVIPIREPLEVGENEDCSKAVSPGTLGSCSCRWLDGERDGDGSGKEDKNDNKRADKSEEKGDGNLKKVILSSSETGVAPLVSLSPPLLHTSSLSSQDILTVSSPSVFLFYLGQVSGNHNTTFISSGQVMNFSGDVIVVCVSQTSHGSDEVGQDDGFGNPVQEEASETAPFFQSSLRSQGNSITHCTLQDETLPVQEVMVERSLGK